MNELARKVAARLKARPGMLVTAESCTGGWVAQELTAIAGSSAWFDRGFVTYSNEAKHELLGVPRNLLEAHGAVSEAVAMAMAEGAIAHSRAECAVSVTGVAGPGGGSAVKPVGMVCFGFVVPGAAALAFTRHLSGDREVVRAASVMAALSGLIGQIDAAGSSSRA